MSIMLSACSKKNDGGASPSGNYYFRATLNGTQKEFRSMKFQGGGNDNRWEHIVVGAYETPSTGAGPLSPSLDFEIWRLGGEIGTGSFSTATEKEMISRYAIQTDNGTLLYNTSKTNLTVNIEVISKEAGIRGTFAGTLANSAGETIEVKNGQFNLPYDELVIK
ncbi:hypothetical protein D0C36_18715 [Mucilaginibacter conchicola]|uniref:Uncharacterized protein n=2 Tax=Mucilaginibacter conchicola TaxID=2303333 RepID=A0A372NPW8_9SPHI|nr:hypothetical protein D0C36_18715 [Mucilaginibacter conchicola]